MSIQTTTEYSQSFMLKEKELTEKILGCAYTVHSELGAGLLENVYETCLEYELKRQALDVKRQVTVPLIYKEIEFEIGYKLDLLIENKVILELKAVNELMDIHTAQLLTYMKLAKCSIGSLINFNEKSLKFGIKRYVL